MQFLQFEHEAINAKRIQRVAIEKGMCDTPDPELMPSRVIIEGECGQTLFRFDDLDDQHAQELWNDLIDALATGNSVNINIDDLGGYQIQTFDGWRVISTVSGPDKDDDA